MASLVTREESVRLANTLSVLNSNVNPQHANIIIELCNARIGLYRLGNDNADENEVKINQGAIKALKELIRDVTNSVTPKNYIE